MRNTDKLILIPVLRTILTLLKEINREGKFEKSLKNYTSIIKI